ncbi:MAG: tRNA U-34 5-methylaminomethyl-2-thiouridine biosynthesis protein [Proteobacteria bacterium]|nr:tRNA U-34 5-methylaminomethyl-2-thiouridine biosynthesis protein [Pseudomonadota bacterium]
MTIVAALLVPGSPLPQVASDNPPWGALANAYAAAGAALATAAPDTLVIYSTQWLAVLDELWLTRARMQGEHVDDNWHEYGALPYDIRIDTALTAAIINATPAIGVRSKGVDYDGFPLDTGTIVASHFLNPAGRAALAVAANNLYHDWHTTGNLGRVAAEQAQSLGRRVALIGVGGLSGSFFRHAIDIATDHIAVAEEDAWNRRMLSMLERGEVAAFRAACPDYARAARVDMGFKHCAFVMGALDWRVSGAVVHGYGPLYGAGGAVVEFKLR